MATGFFRVDQPFIGEMVGYPYKPDTPVYVQLSGCLELICFETQIFVVTQTQISTTLPVAPVFNQPFQRNRAINLPFLRRQRILKLKDEISREQQRQQDFHEKRMTDG